jgi:hypothetical protein
MKHMTATSNSCLRNYNLQTQADKINQVSDSSQDKPVVCFDISELFSTAHLFTRKWTRIARRRHVFHWNKFG